MSDGAAPRVTVVLITHDGAARIERALATALGQTLTALEVVVVNDGSTDATVSIATAVATSDPRVRVLSQANGGPASARNHGIREARGDAIAFLDDDDRWHPRKLEAQLALLDARPGAGLVSCYSALVDAEGVMLGWRLGGDADGDEYAEMLERDLISGGSVAMARRSALLEAGGFDETLPMRSDWDLWIRLAQRYDVVTVRETLVGYTRTPGGLSSGAERMAAAGEEVLARARTRDRSIDERRFRFLQARDSFAVACFSLFDERAGSAWQYLRRSVALSAAPVLRSPRRWGVVGALLLLTVLPRRAYRTLLALACRSFFGTDAGRPFDG